MEEIYAQYGRYLNKVDSFEFPGLSGMDKMAGIMQNLRENPLTEIAGYKVVSVTDYTKPEETGLPSANVLIYKLDNNETVIVRPSGTEPKIKIYYTTLGKDLAEAQAEKDKLAKRSNRLWHRKTEIHNEIYYLRGRETCPAFCVIWQMFWLEACKNNFDIIGKNHQNIWI